MRNFIAGFLSVSLLFITLLLPLSSCTQLKDSTQSNTTSSTVNTEFGDFDIL